MSILHGAAKRGNLILVEKEVEERGRDPQEKATEWPHSTPLHRAAGGGHLSVVKYLAGKKQCDINCANGCKETPLHFACRGGCLPVVQYLVDDKQCEVNCMDAFNHTPLYSACWFERYDIVRVLLDYGANPELLYTSHLELVSGTPTSPGQAIAKIFIIGHPSGGKSTLTKALPSISRGTFSRIRNKATKVTGVKQQTAGIIQQEIDSELFGLTHIYDFAGHEEFYASHDAMVRNVVVGSTGVFLILADLQKCEKEYVQSIVYWLSFVKNHATFMETPPHVLLLGTHADKVGKQEKANRKAAVALLRTKSAFSCINVKGYIEIDCRHTQSDAISQLREALTESFEVLRSKVVLDFTYHCFLIFLLARFDKNPAIQLINAVSALVKETDEFYKPLPMDISELDALCQSLNGHGRILYLRCAESITESWIVLDRYSLLTRVNGTIFAPDDFTEHRSALASSTGVVKLSTLTAYFPEVYPDLISQLITFFEFGRQISDPETLRHLLPPSEAASGEAHYFFPALVCINSPEDVWKPSGHFSYHSGWLSQCIQSEHFFTPRLLQTLILRVCFALALPRTDLSVKEQPAIHRQCKVWKNGVCWSQPSGAEGLLEITSRQVTVLVRSLQGHEMAAVQLRSTLVRMVLEAKKDFCAGIISSESMLYPRDATQYPLSPADDLELFNSAVIARVIVQDEPFVVSTRDSHLKAEELLHFEPYAYLEIGCLRDLGSCESGSIGTLLADSIDCFSRLSPSSEFMRTLKLLARQSSTTREDLRRHFDKYSLFAYRNILTEAGLSSFPDIDSIQRSLDETDSRIASSSSLLNLHAIPTLPLLLCFPGRNRTINVAQEIGVQYQLVGTALLDDTRGTILPGIRAACLAVTDDINIEVLRRWVQGREEGNCSWRSLIGVLRSSGCEALADDIEEAGSAPDTGSSFP